MRRPELLWLLMWRYCVWCLRVLGRTARSVYLPAVSRRVKPLGRREPFRMHLRQMLRQVDNWKWRWLFCTRAP